MKVSSPKLKKSIGVMILFGLVFMAAIATSAYFYLKYAQAQKQLDAETQSIALLVANVEKHILLPTDEAPTVMTVTDKQKLSGQVFFANAKNGDKVLIYEKAKKAFLYDPVLDRVIEVGPIMFEAPTPQGTPTPATNSANPTI